MNWTKYLEIGPYSLTQCEKEKIVTERMNELTEYHYNNCEMYRKVIDFLYPNWKNVTKYEEVPVLPISLFKKLELVSVSREEIIKTVTSSGTTGQQVSKIFLDRQTAGNQQKVLNRIVTSYTGKRRMPMIILDTPSVLRNRAMFSARGAGILGFSLFGSKKIYAFDENMKLQFSLIKKFIEEYEGETIFLFGFTYIIWQYFYKELKKLNEYLPLENAVMIHGGGWKKLSKEAVSKNLYKESLQSVCGIKKVYDYYGMAEQTGCIYMECEEGNLHASIFSDVLVRNMQDFSLCMEGQEGVMQVLSVLPESYPGHSLLTEDTARILGVDNCPCGRKGKYFEIIGRIKNAEIRGCSDTFEK